MATLSVGTGQRYATIASAVAAASSGDVINVNAGTYVNDFVTIRTSLTIQAVGGPVTMLATVSPPNGKAIITEGAAGISVSLSGLTLSGARVADNNGAGIRYEGGTLSMTGMTVTGNQEGLLGGADAAGSISIANSTFSGNGAGDGYSHNIYVGAINRFSLTNSTVSGALVGHDVKSRAANTVIVGNVITDTAGTASYEIDLPNGGNALIDRNVIQKGTAAQNPIAVSYGEEGMSYASNSLVVSNNLMVNGYTAHLAVGVRNASGSVTATMSGNTMYGWASVSSGAVATSGNTVAASDRLFDSVFYLAANPSVTTSRADPYTHYMTAGWKQGLDPSALFSTSAYLRANPDVARAGVNPLMHFEVSGWKEGRNPSAAFDTNDYLAANPDVKASGVNPLLQYLTAGRAEGRKAFAVPTQAKDLLVDATFYYAKNPDVRAAGLDASTQYHATGWTEGRNPNTWFNTSWYLARNPDVAAAHVDPLLHYEAHGWKEGRDPSALFSTAKYLGANVDVRAAGVNPLLHYVVSGQGEGRGVFPI